MSAAPETVPAGGWRAAVEAALAGGARFGGLHAADGPDGVEVRMVLDAGTEPRVLRTPAADGVETVVDLLPAASWDEREAHDLWGVAFHGHEPMRALVMHPDDRGAWATRVTGDGVHTIPVGPTHAGVIESGHFLIHAVGERVLHLDVRLFYKHRGLEAVAAGASPERALAVMRRSCAACAVANAVAIAQALESAAGLVPDEPLRRHRTLLCELERMASHLNDVGQICSGVGLSPGGMVFAALTERIRRVCAALYGHRYLFGAVALGSAPEGPATPARDAARAEVAEVAAEAASAGRALLFDVSLRDRVIGAGVADAEAVRRLGLVGPAARAAGVAEDARTDAGALWYPGFAPVTAPEGAGDVAARLEMRLLELAATAAILDDLLAEPLAAGTAVAGADAGPHGVAVVESPRGATTCAVEVADGAVRRIRLRTSSYANWPGVAHAAAGGIVPDFPLVNRSFELCYACVDR